MNKSILIGRLGKDPETRNFENGSVTTFSLATSETYKDRSGNRQEKTEWHNISFWGKQGEIVAKYFKKGDSILVEGKIAYREYEKDGRRCFITEIQCSSFEFLAKSSVSNVSGLPTENEPGDDDDLPF
jgi:single-strand DNA-binding protein